MDAQRMGVAGVGDSPELRPAVRALRVDPAQACLSGIGGLGGVPVGAGGRALGRFATPNRWRLSSRRARPRLTEPRRRAVAAEPDTAVLALGRGDGDAARRVLTELLARQPELAAPLRQDPDLGPLAGGA
jgi:hypothetical protein